MFKRRCARIVRNPAGVMGLLGVPSALCAEWVGDQHSHSGFRDAGSQKILEHGVTSLMPQLLQNEIRALE
jgi:hypothetical protein